MRHSHGDRQRSVLIVDDDPLFTLLAAETLRQAGFATSVADNSHDALLSMQEVRPDLVLLDVELPDGQGFDVCVRIRAATDGIDIPVVMVTGKHDTASIARAYEVGATDFINKPVLWATLPHRIEFILRAQDTMRALRVSERKNRAMLQALPDAIYILNAAGVIVDHITGSHYPGEGQSAMPQEAARAALKFIEQGHAPGELATHEFEVFGEKDRRTFEARMLSQADGTFLLIIREISERKRTDARIEYLAYFDTLTGLPNRQMLMRHVSRSLAAAQRHNTVAALLYLDLDRFKRINDNLGHSVGDTLLRDVARRLENCLRNAMSSVNSVDPGNCGLVARLGGDEFVILLTDVVDRAHITAVVHEIEQKLGEPFECDGHSFVVTPSIGVAMYPQDGKEIEDLLVKADMAMYQAKDRGRNGHAFYGESMAIRALGRLELEGELRRAIEEEAFELHYQPKMDLSRGCIVGVEALLRWHHRERGWISPDKFIPLAEETGMIVAIGDWVIREACRQMKAWENGPLQHLRIAVNVSVQQFSRDGFVESVLRTLWQQGVKPQQLELEITESFLMRDVDSTRAALQRLGAAGLSLSIDDFGTGYSSLGYLRQFPVDALKIDRSFVNDLPVNSDAVAICGAILALARELKLIVIAEGVETEAQLEFLRDHGCDQAQGYLISRPIRAQELEARIAADPRFILLPIRKTASVARTLFDDRGLA
jgi:diguanylate cyclase (GGDEF)-like protein